MCAGPSTEPFAAAAAAVCCCLLPTAVAVSPFCCRFCCCSSASSSTSLKTSTSSSSSLPAAAPVLSLPASRVPPHEQHQQSHRHQSIESGNNNCSELSLSHNPVKLTRFSPQCQYSTATDSDLLTCCCISEDFCLSCCVFRLLYCCPQTRQGKLARAQDLFVSYPHSMQTNEPTLIFCPSEPLTCCSISKHFGLSCCIFWLLYCGPQTRMRFQHFTQQQQGTSRPVARRMASNLQQQQQHRKITNSRAVEAAAATSANKQHTLQESLIGLG